MLHKRFAASIGLIMTLLSIGVAQNAMTSGSIAGSVFNQQTREPISFANVVVLGSSLGTSTDQNGRFVIHGVPAGSHQVQVSVLGYKSEVEAVIVIGASQGSEYEFSLMQESIDLREVEVHAEQFSTAPDVPVSTRSFSTKEIRNTAGALDDIVRAVKILPGMSQTKADRTDLIVRGGAPSENLFLIDNIEVPYINHFSTQGSGGGVISIIDMDLLSSSSFSSGGFGARYGDKLSSVLDIKLREGRTDRFHTKASLSATQLGVSAEGPLSQEGSFLFSVRKSYLDIPFKMYGFGFAPEFWDYLGKVSYSLGSEDKLTLLLVGAIDKINFFNDTENHRYENSRLLFTDQSHVAAGATWRHLFPDGYSTVTIRHTHSSFDDSRFAVDLTPVFLNSSTESETSIRGDVVMQYAAYDELALGAELRSINTKTSVDLQSSGTAPIDQSLNRTPGNAAVYTQFSKKFENLKLTVGVRGSYFSLIEDKVALAPRLSTVLALSAATNVTASIGRYYQPPSNLWLLANPFNRVLSPIGVNQIIVGIDHLASDDMNISVEGYVKQYFNYPTSLNHPNLIMANTGSGWGGPGEDYAAYGLDSLVSRGSGLSKGIELTIQKKLSNTPFYGMVSVSVSQTRFVALDGVSRSSDYDQRLIVNVGGGYLFGDSWEVSGRFRLYTGRPYTPFQSNGSCTAEEYNATRVGINHQLDLRAARRWTIGFFVLEIYLDVQNVYNRKPVDAPIFNEQRQRAEQVPALGIVPTIGIAVQF